MSDTVKWSIWMTVLGLVTAGLVYSMTSSIGWAVVGLLGAGVVLNALAHPGRHPHAGGGDDGCARGRQR